MINQQEEWQRNIVVKILIGVTLNNQEEQFAALSGITNHITILWDRKMEEGGNRG